MNNRPKDFIFLVTHLFPYPPSQGNELRIIKLIAWLRSQNYKVIVIFSSELEDDTYLNELRKLVHAVYWVMPAPRTRLGRRFPRLRQLIWESAKPLINPRWLPSDQPKRQGYQPIPSVMGDALRKNGVRSPRLAELVARLERRYEPLAVIAEYIFLSDCFALLKSNAIKLIDTHDVLSLKEKQVLAYGIDDPFVCSQEEERAYLLRSDVVVAIQEREATFLKKLVPEREVVTAGVDFDVKETVSRRLPEPPTVTFVGSDNQLNVHGLRSFFAHCWPEIKSTNPQVILNVVGRVGPLCPIDDPAVKYCLRVDDLAELYQQSRVVINPTVAGTGLKIKSAEALAHGKPLVAWPNGVEGLDYVGEAPYIVCHSWKEFARAVNDLLHSDEQVCALRDRALEYARSRFASEQVYASLKRVLDRPKLGDEETTISAYRDRVAIS